MRAKTFQRRFYRTAAALLLIGVFALLAVFCTFVRQQSLNRSLTLAVKNNFATEVDRLLNAGADPNAPQSTQGGSPQSLFQAMIQRFHTNRPARATTLLHTAARWRTPHKGQTWNQKKADRQENTRIIQALLNHGAKVNAQDAAGVTPLMIALTNRKMEAAWYLMMHHANADMKTDDGWCLWDELNIRGMEFPYAEGGGRFEMHVIINTALHAPPGMEIPSRFRFPDYDSGFGN